MALSMLETLKRHIMSGAAGPVAVPRWYFFQAWAWKHASHPAGLAVQAGLPFCCSAGGSFGRFFYRLFADG